MEIKDQDAILNNPWHIEILLMSERIFLFSCKSNSNNNSITVKSDMILIWIVLIVIPALVPACVSALAHHSVVYFSKRNIS
jgi:hypothetical protein